MTKADTYFRQFEEAIETSRAMLTLEMASLQAKDHQENLPAEQVERQYQWIRRHYEIRCLRAEQDWRYRNMAEELEGGA